MRTNQLKDQLSRIKLYRLIHAMTNLFIIKQKQWCSKKLEILCLFFVIIFEDSSILSPCHEEFKQQHHNQFLELQHRNEKSVTWLIAA